MRGWRLLGASALAAALGLAAVPATPAAAKTASTRVGKTPRVPAGAVAKAPLAKSAVLHVDVTLQPQDPAALAAYAEEVATPGSALYRHYITAGQFAQRFGPSHAAIGSVDAALVASGLRPGVVAPNHLSIPVRATAAQLGAAFSTGFAQYAVPGGRVAYANTAAPQFPSSAAPYVQGVVGLDDLSVPTPAGAKADSGTAGAKADSGPAGTTPADRPADGGPQACSAQATAAQDNGSYTTDDVGDAYGFPNLYDAGDLGAGQTVALYELQGYGSADIATYESCFGVTTPVTTVNVDGGPTRNSGVGEADVDIETVASMAPGVSILDYQAPNVDGYDVWNAIISQDVAKVVSTSWGLCENFTGSSEAAAENTLFEEASTQGQTILDAAGDWGSEDCLGSHYSNDFLNVDETAGQPFVTGVGGTEWTASGTPPSETAWNDGPTCCWGAGGGGVSSFWAMPVYQTDAAGTVGVIDADSSGTPCDDSPSTNPSPAILCRQVPDVSALAGPFPYWMYVSGGWGSWGGTSLAAPLWAALMALTNASAACGGTAVGFANPLLYAVAGTDPSAFNDVSIGDNDLTGRNGGVYPALTGYDMATGLGTPNGAVLPAALCGASTTVDPVSVTNPGAQSSGVGQSVTLPITASDTTAGQTLTYRAFGLPAGLSIDPSSGLISGAATTPGSFTVVASAEDTNGASNSATFSWSVPSNVTKLSPLYGPAAGGTVVKITGTGFKGATEVLFGAAVVPATGFTVNKAGTKITVTTPAGTGPVTVQVIGLSGTSPVTASAVFGFAPALSKVTPNHGPVAGGTKVVITGTNFVGVSGVDFGTTPVDVSRYTVNSSKKITAYAPAESAGTETVTVTTSGGTSPPASVTGYTYS